MTTGYVLTVCHEGRAGPTATHAYDTAVEVMNAVPDMLAAHADCHRIHVHAGPARLFSVDCEGNVVGE